MKNKCKEKGFTLVELIISVAILSVVMVALFSFMTAITKHYQNSNNEVTVQNEAQTLLMQLENFIIDANANIGVDGDKLYVMSDDHFSVIEYDSSKGYLYYYTPSDDFDAAALAEYTSVTGDEASSIDDILNKAKALNNVAVSDADVANYLLAEYVSAFSAIPHISENENYVAIVLTIQKLSRSYTASKNVFLRNQIVEPTAEAISTPAATSASETLPVPTTTTAAPTTTTATVTPPAVSSEYVVPGDVDASSRIALSPTEVTSGFNGSTEYKYYSSYIRSDRNYVVLTLKRTNDAITMVNVGYWGPADSWVTTDISFDSNGMAYVKMSLSGYQHSDFGIYCSQFSDVTVSDISYYN